MLTNFDTTRVDNSRYAVDGFKLEIKFQAPEYAGIADNPRYKKNIDIFSVGMIMFYMATAVNLYTEDPKADWDGNDEFEKL